MELYSQSTEENRHNNIPKKEFTIKLSNFFLQIKQMIQLKRQQFTIGKSGIQWNKLKNSDVLHHRTLKKQDMAEEIWWEKKWKKYFSVGDKQIAPYLKTSRNVSSKKHEWRRESSTNQFWKQTMLNDIRPTSLTCKGRRMVLLDGFWWITSQRLSIFERWKKRTHAQLSTTSAAFSCNLVLAALCIRTTAANSATNKWTPRPHAGMECQHGPWAAAKKLHTGFCWMGESRHRKYNHDMGEPFPAKWLGQQLGTFSANEK